ncbi:unnamed protein product [Echinostoma caproni]|uniref:DRBM domain-containing protein n=1 Tax=Echinostoma caproni TaxID=27848 RepID=A0A3P8G7C4_9TREM|nr:unnamed protein product [Echinostoma caproni]
MRHISGLVIYLHRATRVVTLSRPYSVGPGSVRHHQIPVVALPCLAYRKARPTEENVTSATAPAKTSGNALHDPELGPTDCIKSSESVVSIDETETEPSKKSEFAKGRPKNSPLIPSVSDCNFTQRGNDDSNDEDLIMPKRDKEEGELSSGEDDEDGDDDDTFSIGTTGHSRKRGRFEPSSSPLPRSVPPVVQDPLESNPNPRVCLTAEAGVGSGVSGKSVPPPTTESVTPAPTIVVSGSRRRRRKRVPAACPRVALSGHSFSQEASGACVTPSGDVQLNAINELSGVKTQVFAVKDKEVESLLSIEEIRAYCSRLFEIQVEYVPNKRSHREDGSVTAIAEPKASQNRVLMMPEEAKVIRYQLPSADGDPLRRPSKEGLINLTGKSFVCILHEYCQNVIRRPPTYQTVVQENDRNPYQLTVVIDGKPCATGSGQSKKQARLDAGEWFA